MRENLFCINLVALIFDTDDQVAFVPADVENRHHNSTPYRHRIGVRKLGFARHSDWPRRPAWSLCTGDAMGGSWTGTPVRPTSMTGHAWSRANRSYGNTKPSTWWMIRRSGSSATRSPRPASRNSSRHQTEGRLCFVQLPFSFTNSHFKRAV